MKIFIERGLGTKESTGGLLLLNETVFCFTLEDQVRTGEKVPEETAIPAGNYKVKLTMSPKFGYVTPEVLNVPNFTGIRIHAGNTDKDTAGCILVGEALFVKDNDLFLANSKITFDKLMAELRKVDKNGEEITLEIINP